MTATHNRSYFSKQGRKLGLATGLPLIVSACATPALPEFNASSVEDNFVKGTQAEMFDRELPVDSNWWTQFDDPLLTHFVEKALTENRSIDVAYANLMTARVLLEREVLNTSPSTSSRAAIDYGRATGAGRDFEPGGSLNIGASWEWDWMGRLSSQIAAAQATEEASRQTLKDTAVTVSSEAALAYIALRGAQRRLQVAKGNAKAQEEGLDILRDLFNNGRATRLDVVRAEAQYHTTLASIPRLESTFETTQILLRTLTNTHDEDDQYFIALNADESQEGVIPLLKVAPAISSPSELIERRPDIRRAQAQLASLLATSQASRADVYPRFQFDLNLSSVFDDDTIGNLNTLGLGIGPSISWAGPDLRRTFNAIDIADARANAAFAVYEQVVEAAVADVQSSVVTYLKEKQRLRDLQLAAAAAQSALALARIRFEEGLDDYLDVLDAQRTLLSAQDQLAQSQIEATQGAIRIYRSLGGIWTSDALEAPRSKTEQTS